MEQEKAWLYRAEKLDDLLVFQANYQKFRFSNHAHEDFALGLMFDGTQKFHCRGECCYARPGNLITVNAGEVHDGMSADGGSYRYRTIFIPGDFLAEIGSGKLQSGTSPRFLKPVTEDNMLAGRLRGLFHSLDEQNISPLELQSRFYALLTELLRRHGSGSCREKEHKGVPGAVARACAFIEDMARHNITLDNIAQEAGLSRYHFLRLFHTSTGITPHAYLLQRRLQLAKESLRKGSSIADSAIEAGFSDQSHFSRRFKSAFGITPGQYKKATC